jgi:ribosomal protein L12E/L44/L45/RPP1/RPP2
MDERKLPALLARVEIATDEQAAALLASIDLENLAETGAQFPTLTGAAPAPPAVAAQMRSTR